MRSASSCSWRPTRFGPFDQPRGRTSDALSSSCAGRPAASRRGRAAYGTRADVLLAGQLVADLGDHRADVDVVDRQPALGAELRRRRRAPRRCSAAGRAPPAAGRSRPRARRRGSRPSTSPRPRSPSPRPAGSLAGSVGQRPAAGREPGGHAADVLGRRRLATWRPMSGLDLVGGDRVVAAGLERARSGQVGDDLAGLLVGQPALQQRDQREAVLARDAVGVAGLEPVQDARDDVALVTSVCSGRWWSCGPHFPNSWEPKTMTTIPKSTAATQTPNSTVEPARPAPVGGVV